MFDHLDQLEGHQLLNCEAGRRTVGRKSEEDVVYKTVFEGRSSYEAWVDTEKTTLVEISVQRCLMFSKTCFNSDQTLSACRTFIHCINTTRMLRQTENIASFQLPNFL